MIKIFLFIILCLLNISFFLFFIVEIVLLLFGILWRKPLKCLMHLGPQLFSFKLFFNSYQKFFLNKVLIFLILLLNLMFLLYLLINYFLISQFCVLFKKFLSLFSNIISFLEAAMDFIWVFFQSFSFIHLAR